MSSTSNHDRSGLPTYAQSFQRLKDKLGILADVRMFGDTNSKMMVKAACREGISGGPSPEYVISMVVGSQAKGPLRMDMGYGQYWRPNRVGDIIIAPGGAHVTCDGPGPFQSLTLSFHRQEIESLLAENEEELGDLGYLHSRTIRDQQLELKLLYLWMNLDSTAASNALCVDTLLTDLLTHVLGVAQRPLVGPKPKAKLSKKALNDCLEFMKANLHRRIALDDISNSVGFSRSHLAKLFKRTTGTTLHQQLIAFRVERAKALLSSPNAPNLDQIAVDCGFSDRTHLTRCFRQVVGVPPATYRKDR